jgi:hypothetical protein
MEHKAMVYGNALSAFWEKEAQEHIAKKWPHWLNHLINAVGTIRVGTFLKRGGPPGNSPENGRGADSFGFADLDLEYSVNSYPSLSAVYPYGDPRRIFAQGNQEQLWHLVSEVWKYCAPTPERIDKEISRRPAVKKKYRCEWGHVGGLQLSDGPPRAADRR